MSAAKPGRRRPIPVRAAEDVRGVRRRGDERLLGRELHLRAGEREDEREAVAERAAGVEVRREGDRARPRRRARAPEASGGRGRARSRAGARRSRRSRRAAATPVRAGRLEVVDRARAELDRERDRTRLRELVAVEPQREPGVTARLEVAARLRRRRTSRARGRRPPPRRAAPPPGSTSASSEVEVGVGVVELGRHRVGAEPRRDPAGRAHGPQLRELRVVVEAVARLALERRRAVRAHPRAVALA